MATVSVLALRTDLHVVRYEVETPKLSSGLRLALLTDLHSCAYGPGQRKLLDLLHEQNPDAVLLGGDIVDDKLPQSRAVTVLQAVAARYPCFYVTGNHEFYSGEAVKIKEMVEGCGIQVLAGNVTPLEVRGQRIDIAGVDDPKGSEALFSRQLVQCAEQRKPEIFTVLLAHRPEPVRRYLAHGFDLILSGHTHGGQWRIPGVLNGFLAPHQGFFPSYAGGLYPFAEGTMVVSRGLARESTIVPRIFNRPELVIVNLLPENGGA